MKTPISILIKVKYVPENSIVSKATGSVKFKVKKRIKLYDENKNSVYYKNDLDIYFLVETESISETEDNYEEGSYSISLINENTNVRIDFESIEDLENFLLETPNIRDDDEYN